MKLLDANCKEASITPHQAEGNALAEFNIIKTFDMRLVITSLFILSMIASSCGTSQTELTVMSFNIRMDTPADGINQWENRIPLFTEYMDSVAPDIAGMQEVVHNQLLDINDIMPGYTYVGTGRDDGKTGGEYSPVFYREDRFNLMDHGQFWLSETPNVPGSRSWDAAITRIVSWAALEDKINGKLIYVFNTHFDHRGVQARLNSAELISDKIVEIAGDAPVLVLGDFNIRKGSDDYNFMVDIFEGNNGLKNTEYVAKTPVTNADATFNGFRTDTEPRVIDFIFGNDTFGVSSYRVDKVTGNGIFISDHWPVVAVLEY